MKKHFLAIGLAISMAAGMISAPESQAAVMDLTTDAVPMDVRPSGNAFRTTFNIPTEKNGYALVVQQCQLGTHLVPISSSGYLIFNLAFDGEWITDTYVYHQGTLQGYYPVPSHAWQDRKVDITFVTFRLGSYGNLLDPDNPTMPGGIGVGYGSTRVEDMWLRVWYTLGADIQAPTGSIRIHNDPSQADRRHVLLVANVTDNSGHISQMRYRFGDGAWSDWMAYQASRPIVMPGAVTTPVTAQYRDAAGNAGSFSATYDPTERLAISPASRHHVWPAQSGTFTVESNLDAWLATTDADWISIDSGTGSNDGTVQYALTANTGAPRTEQINISGSGLSRVFTVTQDHSGFSAGDGTRMNPFQIANVIGLHAIKDDLAAHYALATNLDLVGETFSRAVIAPYVTSNSPLYTGSFDGNGFTISNLTINAGGNSYLGLFGRIGSAGEVRNLRIEAATLTGTGDYYGVLAGHSAGTISHCSVAGSLSARNYVGGLLGCNAAGGVLTYARASVAIQATGHAGGLVGRNERGAVLYCHSIGAVAASANVGGLVGSRDTTGNYRDVANFWDTQTSQRATSVMGTGRDTAQMQTQSMFTDAGWDFAGENANGIFDDWIMGDDGYPDLHLFSTGYAVPVLSGSGTLEAPFLISEPRDLAVSALNRFAHYRLVNDLDLTGVTFHNRAVVPWVEGSFDGNGNVVHGLRILGGETDRIGFFGTIARSGRVYDLAIEKAHIIGGRYSVGGLAGYNAGAIIRCSVSAEMRDAVQNIGGLAGVNDIGVILDSLAVGSITGGKQIGGLAGWNGSGAIRRSRAAVTVAADEDNIGGLVGVNSGGMVSHCYAVGSVSGSQVIGGLAGYHQNGTISFCYASGNAAATGGFVGGLLGHNQQGQVVGCYATGRPSGTSNVGGLAGFRAIEGNYLDLGNFWDTQTSQRSTSIMGAGRTTTQMRTQSTFTAAGWDFAGDTADGIHDDWIMPENGYPQLNVFSDSYEPRVLPGAGTQDDPYRIADSADLMAVRENDSAIYRLVNDIDLAGVTFGMQAVVPFFSGILDGGGHAIRNLTIAGGGNNMLGLFGRLEPGSIVRNLRMDNCSISGGGLIGGLAGMSHGTIERCSVSGTVSASGMAAGGLVGGTGVGSVITESSAAVNLSGGGLVVGGLVGWNSGIIRDTYARGNISGSSHIGGLVGWNYQARIQRSYSTGRPSGSSDIGGLVGARETGGNDLDSANFWDTQTSLRSTSVMGAGRNTAQMRTQTTFSNAGWNFSNVWSMPEMPQGAYPELRWQRPVIVFDPGEHGEIEAGDAIQQVTRGTAAVAPEIVPLDDFIFLGWDGPFDPVSHDVTLSAVYGPVASNDVIVTFRLDGKAVYSDPETGVYSTWLVQQIVPYGAAAIAPSIQPMEGCLFEGWDADLSAVTNDLMVNAIYAPGWIVTFDLDGKGERTGGGELVQAVYEGQAATAPAVQANTGWIFEGWDTAFDNVTSRLRVNAQYRLAGGVMEFNPNASDNISMFALQADGKILVGGNFWSIGGQTRNRIARLYPDGSLDAAFNPNVSGWVRTLAVQSDGKIIVGGRFTSIGGQTRNRIARLNSDGTLDTSFNPNANDIVTTLAVQADGKILAGGVFTSIGGVTRNRIARLNPDGTLDTDFDPNASGTVNTLAVQSNGKILIGGTFMSIDGVDRYRMARLNPDGTLDFGFNPGAAPSVLTLVEQADGKILVGGSFNYISGVTHNNLARLNPDGTLDTGFNPNVGGTVNTLAVQADGTILVGGEFTSIGGMTRNRIARLTPDGTLDAGFNPNANNSIFTLALRPDGTILVGGAFTSMGGVTRNRIAGLYNDEASEQLLVPSAGRLEWRYGGAFPEAARVVFDRSVDEGTTWSRLGTATRADGGWQLSGINLSSNGIIRGQATISNGGLGESIAERLACYSFPAFSVQFDLGEYGVHIGGGALTQTVGLGGAALAPDIETAPGWAHVGWNVAFDHITDDVACTAQYLPTHTVTFDLDGKGERIGGGDLAQIVPDGYSAIEPLIQGQGNWVFLGWNRAFASVDSNINVWAQYRKAISGEHDANFDLNLNNSANTLALQADGKILVGGWFTSMGGQPRNRIARLNPDGTLDAGFNPNADGTVNTLALQADGKILVGGWFTSMGGQPRNRIARLNPDGTPDAGFTPNAGGTVNTLAVQADGKVLVGGSFTSMGGEIRNRIARLHPDGSLDAGFDPNADGEIMALVPQPDGKILIGGGFTQIAGTPREYMARIHSDGTLDEGFSPNVEMINTWNPLGVETISLRPDGKIYAGGDVRFIEGETRHSYLARFNTDGALDLDFYMPPRTPIYQIALQADGRLFVGGSSGLSINGIPQTRLFLVNDNGAIDAAFDQQPVWFIRALALQTNGKLVIGGSLRDGENEAQANLLRLYVDEAHSHLTVSNTGRIEWLSGGSYPAAIRVTFDLSLDGGETWSFLGTGSRTDSGWQLEGLDLPDDGTIRGLAVISHGGHGESLLAQIVSFPMPELTVQFDVGDHGSHVGGGALTQTIAAGGAAVEPQIEPQAGWAHVGWDTTFNRVTTDLIATARYLPTYTVTFDLDNQGERTGGGELTQMVIYGRGAAVPLVQGLDYRVLGGWDTTFDTVTNDLTVTAWYHPPHTVTFDLDGKAERTGGGALTQIVPHGGSAMAPALEPHEGLAFVGWDTPFDLVLSGLMITAQYRTPIPGDLTAFNPNANSSIATLAVQADGMILVGGSFTSLGDEPRNRIARLHPDGTLDPVFNPNASGSILTLAVQADGKILLGGVFTNMAEVVRNRLARLNPDGSLDTDFHPDVNGTVRSLASQADGKILVGGSFTTIGGQTRNRIARLNPDGTLDTDFNPDANNNVETLAVQADGKILVGGDFTSIGGVTRNRIARLNPDGSLDTGFNPNSSGQVYTLAVQADGKILVGGNFTTLGGQERNRIARLNPNGTLDTDFNPNASSWVWTLAVQADGKILVGGWFTSIGGMTRNLIARLNPDGTLDIGFYANVSDTVRTLALQADGKILAGGSFTSIGGVTRNRIAVLHNDGASDQLVARSGAHIEWACRGAFPQAARVVLDLSADDGETWQQLGLATHADIGWEKTGLSLPANGIIRGRMFVSNGGKSESLIERQYSFSFPAFTVEFVPGENGTHTGGGALNQLVVSGVAAIAPEIEPADGWAHMGWDAAFDNVTNHSTITAQYLPVHTVTFDLDGKGERTGGGELTQTILHGGAATAPEIEPAAGWAHMGWDAAFDNVTDHSTITAQYLPVHTVTFDLDGKGERTGGGELTQTILHGGAATAPSVQGSGLFVFGGWDVASDHVTSDLTVTAWYHPPHTVTFDLDGKGERTGGGELAQVVPHGDSATAPTVEGQGDWVFTGWSSALGPITHDITIVAQYRCGPLPGAIDATFNPNAGSTINTLAVQADGKILVGGTFTNMGGMTRNRIARLNPDGTLDTGFNPNAGNTINTLAVQADGKILVGGTFTSMGGVTRNRIARLNPDGTLDTGFNPNAGGTVFTLAIQADGKIVVGGSFTSMGAVTRNRIARLNANGTLDTGFNPNAESTVYILALQPDGKTVIGGNFLSIGGVTRSRIARLNSDGTLDTGFNPNAGGRVEALALQADGRILVGGWFTTMGGTTRRYIARLNPDGTRDTFNPNANNYVHGLALQADGKILAGGSFTSIGGQTRNRIARIHNDEATEQLAVPGAARVIWQCSGAFPEASRVTFDLSINDGATWTSLGTASRVSNGWERIGLNLPTNGIVRGRAVVSNGGDGESLFERFASFSFPSFSVAFDLGLHGERTGGGALDQTIVYGGAAVPPDVQPTAGMAHVGWDTAFDFVTADLTVTAQYLPTYSVTFDLDDRGERTGGGALTQTIMHGYPAVPPTVRATNGWGFGGWDQSFDSVTSDLTVTARYFTLNWSAIGDTPWRNRPIPLTLTARDPLGAPFADFVGPVDVAVEMGVHRPETRQFGTGTTSWNYPMSTYYHDARTQVIYLSDEVGDAGIIRTLALNVSGLPGLPLGRWTLRMRHTSLDAYPATPEWEDEWTVVYQQDTPVQTPGWVVFAFDTPFHYNGMDNLMVDFSHDNDRYLNDGLCLATDAGVARSLVFRSDSGHGDPTAWPTIASSPVPQTSTLVPNIRLGGDWYHFLPLAVEPATAVGFENGIWTGTVTIGEQGTGGRLVATAADGTRWESELFDVLQAYLVTFDIGAHGNRTGGGALEQMVLHGQPAATPLFETAEGWTFDGWNRTFDVVTDDLTVQALYTSLPGTFYRWMSDESLEGDAANLFRQICPVLGVAYGFRYAFGTNLPLERPLLNIRMVNGRAVVETPMQDSSTVPYVDVRVVGTDDLMSPDWTLPIAPATDTTGKPANTDWNEPASPQPDKAFYRLEAELK